MRNNGTKSTPDHCEWKDNVKNVEMMMVFVSYDASCGGKIPEHNYSAKLEYILKHAKHCIHCGKKVKWKH